MKTASVRYWDTVFPTQKKEAAKQAARRVRRVQGLAFEMDVKLGDQASAPTPISSNPPHLPPHLTLEETRDCTPMMLHGESNKRFMRQASARQVVSTLMIPRHESKHRPF